MPRSRRRAIGEGGIRCRATARSDGTKRTRYSAVVTVDWVAGRQRQIEGPQRKTEREAIADLRKLNQKKHAGRLATEDPTLDEYLEYWLGQIEPINGREASRRQVSRKTWRGYSGDVTNHIIPALGRLRMSRLEPTRLQAWQRHLENEHSAYVARSAAATLSYCPTGAR